MEEQNRSALDQLAALAGVASEYTDKMGNLHVTTPETKRTLLSAMRFDVSSEEAIQKNLETLEEAPWRRMVRPVHVFRVDRRPPRMAVTVAADSGPELLTWILTEENGTRHQGVFAIEELRVLERRTLEGVEMMRVDFPLPYVPPTGYHRLRVSLIRGGVERWGETTVVAAPPRCYLPEDFDEDRADWRVWGVPVQLYAVRSRRNWGIGDFTDLSELVRLSARAGAEVIGLNPLGAMFPETPENAGMYASSSRRFLNYLYIDVTAVPEFSQNERAREKVADPSFQEAIAEARATEKVDYSAVAGLKRPILQMLYETFRARNYPDGSVETDRGRAFEHFVSENGDTLRDVAVFQVLSEDIPAGERAQDWRDWGPEWRDVHSETVRRFREANRERVEFYMWLMFEADRQLAEVAGEVDRENLAVGLHPDLPVGVAFHSAETWAAPENFAKNVELGAPPDLRRPKGQTWGIAAPLPRKMQENAYQPFRSMLENLMRHAGALRIDHVFGLFRLFWVPVRCVDGIECGGYVYYPMEDLFGVLALESHRHKCMIIGEDLGTVADGFRERMAENAMLGTKVFLRTRREDKTFHPPSDYPRLALVTNSTHDQPTACGFWTGDDLEVSQACDLYPSHEAYARLVEGRRCDREQTVEALKAEKLLPAWLEVTEAMREGQEMPDGFIEAFIRYMSRTRSALFLLRLEDVFVQKAQVNLPGTFMAYPNWRFKLPVDLEDMADHPDFRRIVRAMAQERPPISRNRTAHGGELLNAS